MLTRKFLDYNTEIFLFYTCSSMHQALIVDLSYIDQLASPRAGDVFGQALLHEGFIGGLDDVHGVAAADAAGRQVRNARGAGHFVDEVLAAVSKA